MGRTQQKARDVCVCCGRKLSEGWARQQTADIGTENWLEVQESSGRVFSKLFYAVMKINGAFAVRYAFLTPEKTISRENRNKMGWTFELQHIFTILS